jgi:AcrR family transcriptional regulator
VVDADARTRLREAALELLGRQGIAATSTRAILTAAGLRNPSAINYHFGSKAQLVEDLVGELISGTAPVLQRQIALAEGPEPTVTSWAGIAVDSAMELIATKRGCLLARLWWDYDNSVQPNALESFVTSDNPIAVEWRDAVGAVFDFLPVLVGVARNVVMLRTLELMIARRAARLLAPETVSLIRVEDPDAARQLMLEVAVGMLTAPTALGDDAVAIG